jgi:predicted SAM-dependent methyltransferase
MFKITTPFIKKSRRVLAPLYRALKRIRLRQTIRTDGEKILSEARALNDLLYEDVRRIPVKEMARFKSKLKDYCKGREFTEEYTEAWLGHRYRLYLTLEWLNNIIPKGNGPFQALELGGESPVTDLLKEYFPNVEWELTKGDLRRDWEQSPHSMDLIVCMELLEHVSDIPEGFGDSFFKTGIKAVLKECYRVLKPGGRLFITTPNVVSVVQLERMLMGASPWFYPLHIREYSLEELNEMFFEALFKVERWQAIHCLTIEWQRDYTRLFQMLIQYQHPYLNRGDDLFFVLSKNAEREKRSSFRSKGLP